MQEGIYAEYGWPQLKKDGTNLTNEELKEREQVWKIHIVDTPEDQKEATKGIAKLSQVAFDGLTRKLLHAMMTNDEFYTVLGGHSAAAGHGNDFQQNRIITFQYAMEPVFNKLGMRLISRNMGMGGVGTLQFSLAGGDLYGETDYLEWDSGMTEKGPPVDLFNKQAILSGERVPIIFTDYQFDVHAETNHTAWMGQYINDNSMMAETTFENQDSMPYAVRWFNQKQEKHNAICWEPRKDFTPTTKQGDHPGSQVGWHPGNRQHQWSGRKPALVLLKALKNALTIWQEGILQEGCPLAEHYWHVGPHYKTIREKLRTHITTPQGSTEEEDVRSACEKMIPWMPRICRVQMHGYGLWNPRASQQFDFLHIIKPAPNGYKPFVPRANLYDGFDLMPLSQAIPDGHVDLHAIAIATTNPPPDLDHSWTEEDDEKQPTNNSTTPPTRRWLRQATQDAFRRVAMMEEAAAKKEKPIRRRRLNNATTSDDKDAIVPGRGWMYHGWDPVRGFCDGSAQSECGRSETQTCLLYGANDKHYDVLGNSLSGWLVFTVPKVKEGIVLIRMEWWCADPKSNTLTLEWTEVNNGQTLDTTPWNNANNNATRHHYHRYAQRSRQRRRRLGKPTKEQRVPADLEMDYVVNGVLKTMKQEEWVSHTTEFSKNVALWPLLNDQSMALKDWEGEPMEVAVRFRSEKAPQQGFCISHVYYA